MMLCRATSLYAVNPFKESDAVRFFGWLMSQSVSSAFDQAGAIDPFGSTRANYERFAFLLLRVGHVPGLVLRHLDFRVVLFLLAQKPGAYAAHHHTIARACDSNTSSIRQPSLGFAQRNFNMDAMASNVKLARLARKPAFFIVNRGRSKGINDDCALALTTAYGLPAVNTHISQRMPIADAERTGLTLLEIASREPSAENGKGEFRALWEWLSKQNDQRLGSINSLPLQICG
jgi:hypothetical protein